MPVVIYPQRSVYFASCVSLPRNFLCTVANSLVSHGAWYLSVNVAFFTSSVAIFQEEIDGPLGRLLSTMCY